MTSSFHKPKIMVVDYGMGNLQSVANALLFLGCNAIISNNKEELLLADAYILPGVGAFGEAIKNLNNLGLIDVLNEQVLNRNKPFLGICLGMQLIAESSEEFGNHKGFGWIPGHVKKLAVKPRTHLPHVGWNDVKILKKEPLFKGIEGSPAYYFVHTYHFSCDENYISAQCRYDIDFVAAVQKENIFATQFHPEKSQDQGLRLMRNYLNFVLEQKTKRSDA